MKIQILHGASTCAPCQSLISAIEELSVIEPELNLSYEVFIKDTSEAEAFMAEHTNRGFPFTGSPVWVLYDDEDNYVKTFLGFPLPDYEHRLEELKQSILLNYTAMDHPLEKLNFPSN